MKKFIVIIIYKIIVDVFKFGNFSKQIKVKFICVYMDKE